MMRTFLILILAAGSLLAASGCGVDDPYNDGKSRATSEKKPAKKKKKPAQLTAQGTAATPEEAVTRVALNWSNWTTANIHQAHERAIELTVGEAATRLKRESQQVENSAVESPKGLRSRGTLEAVAIRGSGDSRRAIVVTRENLAGAGPVGNVGEYKVTLATVERQGDGWVISRWTRQP